MQCNIDAKGKAIRLISGMVMSAVALVLGVLALTGVWTGVWVMVTAGVALAAGLFQIFEARQGWCILRAMGFKTRI